VRPQILPLAARPQANLRLEEDRRAAFEHRHRPDLDGIRGILACAVMLLHFGVNRFVAQGTGGAWNGFVFDLCVDVFFLLSGFVLTSSYLASSNRSFARFATKRFFRLVPVFYVTTLLVLPSAATIYQFEHMPAEIVLGVPFFASLPANYPAWSITWEFYIPIAAFLLAPFVPLPRFALLPLLIACLAVLAFVDAQIAGGLRIYAIRAPLGLVAGALLYRLYAQARSRASWPWLSYALFAALIAVLGVAQALPPLGGLVPPLAAALIWNAAGRPSRLFSSRALQWLGALSYTIYMAHIPVLQTMKSAFGEGIAADPLAMLAGIGLSFALAIALTRLVELPGMRLGNAVIQMFGNAPRGASKFAPREFPNER
jgi:peptidoglycan/LPS O-acetylase OafA/YrhL